MEINGPCYMCVYNIMQGNCMHLKSDLFIIRQKYSTKKKAKWKQNNLN